MWLKLANKYGIFRLFDTGSWHLSILYSLLGLVHPGPRCALSLSRLDLCVKRTAPPPPKNPNTQKQTMYLHSDFGPLSSLYEHASMWMYFCDYSENMNKDGFVWGFFFFCLFILEVYPWFFHQWVQWQWYFHLFHCHFYRGKKKHYNVTCSQLIR